FSTLILSDVHGDFVVLSRQSDFPPRQHDFYEEEFRDRPDWQPSPCPTTGSATLHLQLRHRIGSGGRSAVVYAVEVLTPPESGHDAATSRLLERKEQLCVKIARPNRCRTLAREAWVFENMHSRGHLQGVIAPRCYGLFTAQLDCPLWRQKDFNDIYLQNDKPTRDDRLPDDDRHYGHEDDQHDDNRGGRECSPWFKWRPDPASPLLAALVMTRGGETYTEDDHEEKDSRCEDVRAIFEDLSKACIFHGDIRRTNIVRAPESTALCKRHNCVHKWHLIDFASTWVDD
ncbi:hypothetical protein C8Q72DRAFT_743090, partial [Fomitopsis betulina]